MNVKSKSFKEGFICALTAVDTIGDLNALEQSDIRDRNNDISIVISYKEFNAIRKKIVKDSDFDN